MESRALLSFSLFYGIRKGLLLMNSPIAISLSAPSYCSAILFGHFAMETVLDEPRLLQCEFPTDRYERASLAHRSDSKTELGIDPKTMTKLRKVVWQFARRKIRGRKNRLNGFSITIFSTEIICTIHKFFYNFFVSDKCNKNTF